jgi:hypothetical protein
VSVEFEPVRLGRRGRRVDPIALTTVAVVLGLLVAVLKPWDAEKSTDTAAVASPAVAASAVAVGLSGPRATASVPIPRVIQARAAAGLTWDAVDSAVRRHETWGVRAIVVDRSRPDTPISSRSRLVEAWFPVPGMDGGETPSVQVDPGGRSIVALGVTFPPAHTPLDIRVWRATSTGLDWVDTQSVDAVPSEGAFLYVRPGSSGRGPVAWGPGTYRVDVLVDGTIRRFEIGIPNRFANVPEPSEQPNPRDVEPLLDPEPTRPDVPVGLFATVGGVAIPLPAGESAPLDETGAWLNVDPGTGRPPRSFVASAYLPRATRLGVLLPPRSVVMTARLVRLAPGPLTGPQRVMVYVPTEGAPMSSAVFSAPTGTEWTPGVYRLTVVWADFEGLHEESWHAELRPGPVRAVPTLLAAARAWARYAGTTGVLLGRPEPSGTGSTSSIREVPLRPASASYPARTGVGCGETVIVESPGIFGFAYPADREASVVTARIERPFLHRDDQVLMTVDPGIPGLRLAAPARIASIPGADWVFTVRTADGDLEYALCLGMATFGD